MTKNFFFEKKKDDRWGTTGGVDYTRIGWLMFTVNHVCLGEYQFIFLGRFPHIQDWLKHEGLINFRHDEHTINWNYWWRWFWLITRLQREGKEEKPRSVIVVKAMHFVDYAFLYNYLFRSSTSTLLIVSISNTHAQSPYFYKSIFPSSFMSHRQ